MPNPGQGSGRLPQSQILHEPDDLRNRYFQSARTHRGHEMEVATIVGSRFQPYHPASDPGVDNCAGLDSSSYEGSIDERDANHGGYPSSRIAITQVSHQGVDIAALARLNAEASQGGCVNPVEMMSALGGVGALDFWFCSSNLLPEGALSAADGFRQALCDALRKPQARLPSCADDEGDEIGWSLLSTYHHLMLQMESLGLGKKNKAPIQVKNGQLLAVHCEECRRNKQLAAVNPPVAFSPNRKTFAAVADPNANANDDQQARCPRGHVLSELEALGLPGDFSAELTNYPVFHRFGMLVETLRAMQILLAQTTIKPPGNASVSPWPSAQALGKTPKPMGVAVLVDGPMALMGQAQVLVPPLRAVLDNFLSPETSPIAHHIPDSAQALIFGVIKTGLVHNFISSVNRRLEGTADEITPGSFWVIDSTSRADWITRQRGRSDEYGMETHLGHEIAVKTRRGHLFVLSVPLPLPPAKPGTKPGQQSLAMRFCLARQALGDPSSPQYAYLMRVLALLEIVQSSLFGASTVPQVLAHEHASLSWQPSGAALLASIRAARRGI